jgi:hypothetical protein
MPSAGRTQEKTTTGLQPVVVELEGSLLLLFDAVRCRHSQQIATIQ